MLASSGICTCDLIQRAINDFTDKALKVVTDVLVFNPEYYSMWNYRRDILATKKDLDFESVCQVELKLVDSLLKRSPKSYWIWNHRHWILESSPKPLWQGELKLINYMQNLDPRNFHSWDYRRYVMEMSQINSPLQEFEYTTLKIQQNFSNFSAWHYRSKLLISAFPDLTSRNAEIQKGCHFLSNLDFEFIRNAIFTEPNDQSAWLYQRFLLGSGKYFIYVDSTPIHLSKAVIFYGRRAKLLVLFFNQPVNVTSA